MARRKTTAATTTDEAAVPVTILDSTATDAGAESILSTNFSVVDQDALTLMQAASQLSDASAPDSTPEAVSQALDHNLKIWVAIKTVIQRDSNTLPAEVKDNLATLAQYVSATTMEATQGGIEPRRLVALARVNTQIAEGLMRGQARKMIEERAYEIWEAEGRPEGRGMEHWLQAEKEVNPGFSLD